MPGKKGPLSQRRVALELRAAIDIARQRPTSATINEVEAIVRENSRAVGSRHVEHNLGQARLDWLYENGLLPLPVVANVRPALSSTPQG